MFDLGLFDFCLTIRSHGQAFHFIVSFFFEHTGRDVQYRAEGTAPSPDACYDQAMSYLADCVREAF